MPTFIIPAVVNLHHKYLMVKNIGQVQKWQPFSIRASERSHYCTTMCMNNYISFVQQYVNKALAYFIILI